MLYNFYRVKANKGMTLIELLVAISILATVAVMGWYALGSILRARQILEQEMRNMHDVQIAFSQIEVDCEKIAPRELIPSTVLFAANAHELLLVRRVETEGEATAYQVITYRAISGKLTRTASRSTRFSGELLAQYQAAQDGKDTFESIILTSHVVDFQVRPLDQNDARAGNIAPGNVGSNRSKSMTQRIHPTRLVRAVMAPGAVEVLLYFAGQPYPIRRILLLGIG